MSCILIISGLNFDVDAFVAAAAIPVYKTTYRGEPITKTGARIAMESSVRIVISDADFDEIKTQIEEATDFLIKHRANLKHIITTAGIDYAGIDFGADSIIDDEHLTQGFYFTKPLVQICAELGLEIALSLYKPDMEVILENNRVKD